MLVTNQGTVLDIPIDMLIDYSGTGYCLFDYICFPCVRFFYKTPLHLLYVNIYSKTINLMEYINIIKCFNVNKKNSKTVTNNKINKIILEIKNKIKNNSNLSLSDLQNLLFYCLSTLFIFTFNNSDNKCKLNFENLEKKLIDIDNKLNKKKINKFLHNINIYNIQNILNNFLICTNSLLGVSIDCISSLN